MQIGTLTANTRRQLTAARRPPKMSPMKDPASSETPLMPRASPRWSAGKASVRMAAELPIIIAPPVAWIMRRMMISSAAVEPSLHTSVRPTAAAVKTMRPVLNMRTRPNMSPRRPAVTTRAAATSPYPMRIQRR